MLGKIKTAFDFVRNVWKNKKMTGDQAATLSMRWARPIFFILMTVMFLWGWNNPEMMGGYFEQMAKAPEWLTNIFTILILGLAVEKGISRPLQNTMVAIKGKKDGE